MHTPKKTKRRSSRSDPPGTFTGKCALDGTPAEQEAALMGLASVIVDELMLLRKQGKTPAQIRATYGADGSGPSQPI